MYRLWKLHAGMLCVLGSAAGFGIAGQKGAGLEQIYFQFSIFNFQFTAPRRSENDGYWTSLMSLPFYCNFPGNPMMFHFPMFRFFAVLIAISTLTSSRLLATEPVPRSTIAPKPPSFSGLSALPTTPSSDTTQTATKEVTGTDAVAPAHPLTSVDSTGSAFGTASPTNPRASSTIRVTGVLQIPVRNRAALAAAYPAVLRSLQTPKIDAAGQPVLDTALDGTVEPVMIPVVEGMVVRKGQVLGNLDDRELKSRLKTAKTELEVAIAAMEKEIEIDHAARGVQHAQAKLNMLEGANKISPGAFSLMEIKVAEFEVLQAQAQLELQKYVINVERKAATEVRREQINEINVLIELRKLIAPLDGMILKIAKSEGEWLREGDVVYEIAQLNTLQVECQISANNFTVEEVLDRTATVTVLMPDGQQREFAGKVVFVNPQVAYASGMFLAYVEVQNQSTGRSWVLQPGKQVDVQIHLQAE